MLIYSGEINDRFLAHLLSDEGARMILCSPGGSVEIMRAALDFIQAKNTAVFGTGCIMSAAVPILAAGSTRVCTRRTRFMVHNAIITLGAQSPKELQLESDEMKKLQDAYWEDLASFSKRPAKWWAKQCVEAPFYFGPEEARQFGIIDGIA